jgi:hypothetical protein
MHHSTTTASSPLKSSRSQDHDSAPRPSPTLRGGRRRRSFNIGRLPEFSKEMMLTSVKDIPLSHSSLSSSFSSFYPPASSSTGTLSNSPSTSLAATTSEPSASSYQGYGSEADVRKTRRKPVNTPSSPDLASPGSYGQSAQGTSGLSTSLDDEFDIPTPRPRHTQQSTVLDSARISEALSASMSRTSSTSTKSHAREMSRKGSSGSSSGFRAYLAGSFARHRPKTDVQERSAQAEAGTDEFFP